MLRCAAPAGAAAKADGKRKADGAAAGAGAQAAAGAKAGKGGAGAAADEEDEVPMRKETRVSPFASSPEHLLSKFGQRGPVPCGRRCSSAVQHVGECMRQDLLAESAHGPVNDRAWVHCTLSVLWPVTPDPARCSGAWTTRG